MDDHDKDETMYQKHSTHSKGYIYDKHVPVVEVRNEDSTRHLTSEIQN